MRLPCLRFRLRTFLLVTILVAVAVAFPVGNAERQRRAAAAINRVGGTVFYDYAQSHDSEKDEWSISVSAKPPDHWVTRWLGRDYRHKIVGVHGYTEHYYSSPPGVFYSFGPTKNETDFKNRTDEAIKTLRGLNLRFLDLSDTAITDEGLAMLPTLLRTQRLQLSQTAITDAGLVHLPRMRGLESLSLAGVPVTQQGFDRLQAECPDLYIWSRRAAKVRDDEPVLKNESR